MPHWAHSRSALSARHRNLEELERAARRLPRPSSRFAGLPLMDIALPRNVRMAARTHPGELSPKPHQNPDVYVLVVGIRGRGIAKVDGQPIRLSPGHGLLIFPRQFHCFTGVQDRLCWLLISFRINRDDLLWPLRSRPVSLPPALLAELNGLAAWYLAAADMRQMTSAQVSLRLVQCLLGMRAAVEKSRPAAVRPAKRDAVMARAIRHLVDHVDRPLSVRELARSVGVSGSALRQLFRDAVGLSPGAYLRRLRLQRASSLMADPALNLKQIAGQSGFASLQSFSRAFHKVSGAAPTAYRKLQSAAGRFR